MNELVKILKELNRAREFFMQAGIEAQENNQHELFNHYAGMDRGFSYAIEQITSSIRYSESK